MAVMRNGKEQFASLELLRVIASLMIILFHAHSIALKNARLHDMVFFPPPMWWYSCIDLFFTMSGFLMIYMSRNLYGSAQGARVFAARRAIRTPPLYWLYTLLITGLFLLKPSLSAEGPIDLRTFLCSIFFYPNVRNPVIAIGWTLNYEIFFYAIIGLSIFLPYAKGWKCAAAALIAAVALGYIFNLHSSPFGVWTDPLMLDFVIGILVAVLYYRGIAVGGTGAWLLLCAGLALIGLFDMNSGFFLSRTLTAGLGMGCVVAAATLPEKPISFGKAGPLISLLSRQTYTMYLCHILVLKGIELVFFRYFYGFWANLVYIVGGTIITVIISRGLYEVIEKPLSEMLRKQLKAGRPGFAAVK